MSTCLCRSSSSLPNQSVQAVRHSLSPLPAVLTPAVDLLATSSSTSPSTPPLLAFASSLNQLSTLIDQALAYVQSVNAGTTPADPEIGRFLLEGIGRWSSTGSEDEGGVRQGVQDTLTVAYLSNLVRSQVELSGRLGLLQAQPQAQQPTTA